MQQHIVKFARRFSENAFLSSTTLLSLNSFLVNGANFLSTILAAHHLSSAEFADVTLIITISTLMTVIMMILSTIAAKNVAADFARGDYAAIAALKRWLEWRALYLGFGIAALFIVGAGWLSQQLHTASAWPFVIFASCIPAFLVISVERGVLQGIGQFGRLALSFQTEIWVRLVGTLLVIAFGGGINGMVGALAISFSLAGSVALRLAHGVVPSAPQSNTWDRRAVFSAFLAFAPMLFGQVLINNSDLVMVKYFFPADVAGQYAALGLSGRMVFTATWSIVTVLLPMVVQKQIKGDAHRHLLGYSLAIVAAISGSIIVVLWRFPEIIVNVLFGPQYAAIGPLLWLYALATGLYTLASVVISYQLSLRNGQEGWIILASSFVQIAAIGLLHNSLDQVVIAQVITMASLLFVTLGLLRRSG
jgi:O-antigen/teichoic acid export membrane protein